MAETQRMDQTSSLSITAPGEYNIVRTGGAKESTVYIYGTDGGAALELHGPGGLLEDGVIAALPYQKVIHHGGIPILLSVTGGAGIDIRVRVG